jgi:hypothetical protein
MKGGQVDKGREMVVEVEEGCAKYLVMVRLYACVWSCVLPTEDADQASEFRSQPLPGLLFYREIDNVIPAFLCLDNNNTVMPPTCTHCAERRQ